MKRSFTGLTTGWNGGNDSLETGKTENELGLGFNIVFLTLVTKDIWNLLSS